MAHAALAAAAKTPEFELNELEAKVLAEPTVTLLELYDIKPDPRLAAALACVSAFGTIYGVHWAALQQRLKAERSTKVGGHSESDRRAAPAAPMPVADGPPPAPAGAVVEPSANVVSMIFPSEISSEGGNL